MGLLDDAIREHLELKLRNGADPAEVARQERDALGPARRGPEPLEVPPEPAQEAHHAGEPDLAEEAGAPLHREPDADVPEFLSASPREPREPEPDPLAEAPPVEPEHSAAVPAEADIDWEAPPPDEPEPRAAAEPTPSHLDQPTVAFDAADIEEAQRRPPAEPAPEPPARRAEPEPADAEDVLEETPDFLQETPEHDRLWFEQRPPRDFDFDG